MAGIIRRIVFAPGLPKPAAPYSPAVIVDKTMYVSGQLGVDASGEIVSGGLEAEAEQALKNLQTLLQSVGSDLGNVVKVTVLLSDISEWPKLNVIYGRYFTSNHPARTAFQVGALPKGAKVEIEAIAVIGNIEDRDN